MSTLKIEERIAVSAPPARVWRFLLDPARVAACLPGAKLDGTEGDHTFLGTMKVKVGPVLMEFKGKATMSEVVEAERRVTLTGTGNDKSGGGSAKMEMKSRIEEKEGGSEIIVVADVDLAGKLVRFGRGMMEGISKQLFKQFSERVQAALASEPEGEAPAKAEEEPKQEEAAKEEAASAPPKAEEAPETKVEEAPAKAVEEQKSEPVAEAPVKAVEEQKSEPVAEAPAKAEEQPAPAAKAAKKAPAPLVKQDEDEVLDAGSLVWAAIWAWIKNLFRRIFGGGGRD